jgi:hypothetical protein
MIASVFVDHQHIDAAQAHQQTAQATPALALPVAPEIADIGSVFRRP